MILTIRTDKPEAEIGLYNGKEKVDYMTWHAHRSLSADIHKKIKEILDINQLTFDGISGIVFYKGPGSFTGLRIGASVANTMSDTLKIPIIGGQGDDWIEDSTAKILDKKSDRIVLPDYGSPAHTTKPKK